LDSLLRPIIQAAQLTEIKHYCSFHRFFSQARWNLDDLGHCVFQLLLPFCTEVLVAAVDDTLARKSGRHIWGAGMHHDPLRSTQKRPFFAFGHNFVVFSLQVALPFAPNTQRHGAITQGILALRALRVLQDLARCGLSNVEIRIVLKMLLRNFQFRHAENLPFEC
jgi:hypothetical protein